jgi:hypothetical protein
LLARRLARFLGRLGFGLGFGDLRAQFRFLR